jgi:hypothetical protein
MMQQYMNTEAWEIYEGFDRPTMWILEATPSFARVLLDLEQLLPFFNLNLELVVPGVVSGL